MMDAQQSKRGFRAAIVKGGDQCEDRPSIDRAFRVTRSLARGIEVERQ